MPGHLVSIESEVSPRGEMEEERTRGEDEGRGRGERTRGEGPARVTG